MNNITCDVAVIGGGPAGSATALLLARRGYQVTLFDRDDSSRPKACGEYLTPGAVSILRDTLGVLPLLMAQGAMPITRETIYPQNGNAFGGKTQALACPRTVTDTVLRDMAREAGAQIIPNASVQQILQDHGHTVGVQARGKDGTLWECYARLTVGADGTRSLLARTMGVVHPIKRLQHIALVGHFQDAGNSADDAGTVEMHLPVGNLRACCGVGASCGPERARNINIVVPLTEAPRMAGRRDAYFDETLRVSFPRVWEQRQRMIPAAPLLSVPCFGHYTARATADGALLVGDAATFIHPFTGEGVFFALRGAQLASETIDLALRAGKVSADTLQGYDAARARDILPRYRLSDTVQRVVHSPALLGLTGAILRRSPVLTHALLGAVSDLGRPRDWFLPSSLTRPGNSPTYAY